MNIAILGCGYVGLVTGSCFSDIGLNVTCMDISDTKIDNLNNGIIPIYEPGLEELMNRNVKKKRLHFTNILSKALEGANIIFIAVGTPENEDGSANLSYVFNVAKEIGNQLNHYAVIVIKSTVPIGVSEKVRDIIQLEINKRGVPIQFDIVSNPEFLKEGAAINDFFKPDRIVVGANSERAINIMQKLYKPFTLNGHPILIMDNRSAEMTKYAANSMLATKISFMNDIANLCELLNVNVEDVRKGVGSDSRIGQKFIYPGIGYGGSCFPKDVKAIIKIAEASNYEMNVLKAVQKVNEKQKKIIYDKLLEHFDNNISDVVIGVWGLSFKPQTNDMREAPSLSLINELIKSNIKVKAYDPIAIENAKEHFGNKIIYCEDEYEAANDVDALIILTEWSEFKYPNWEIIKKLMKGNTIFDGRNIFQLDLLKKAGFNYYSVGRPPVLISKSKQGEIINLKSSDAL